MQGNNREWRTIKKREESLQAQAELAQMRLKDRSEQGLIGVGIALGHGDQEDAIYRRALQAMQNQFPKVSMITRCVIKYGSSGVATMHVMAPGFSPAFSWAINQSIPSRRDRANGPGYPVSKQLPLLRS